MSVPSRIADVPPIPSLADLRELTLARFQQNACNFQLDFARAILEGKKHVLLQAGCGMGKTLSFWVPLLARTSGSFIVVTPLTLLGDQHVENLSEAGIQAVNIDANAIANDPHIFNVEIFVLINRSRANARQDIGSGVYRVVITSPEQLMKEGGGFQQLLRKTRFASQLIAIVIDEVHCLKLWSSFRRDYQDLGRLRFILPDRVHFALVSATLPRSVLAPVMSHLGITPSELYTVRLSNDRDNVALCVRKMRYPANSFRDLDFLVSQVTDSDVSGSSQQRLQHKKFVIFFDNKTEATDAGSYLRSKLPMEERDKIIWFMADMSAGFKQDGVTDLASGKLLGICATDSFGMGIDLKDIDLVVQWKVTCDPCMLWQRFGRGARDKDVQATALLFVESKDLDPVDATDGRKRKAPEEEGKTDPKSKRAKKDKPVPMIQLESSSSGRRGRKYITSQLVMRGSLKSTKFLMMSSTLRLEGLVAGGNLSRRTF
ncbi:P-loop containing nucleoside triphosphate hydrolase protein [Thelephora terrestris]|uniref:DNA 3'-5' helicase n=1 Tax=Thelephora terrestris TaxID=56493 RepID=A0A9P6HN29_9AGAM|nr:P-loop containing nucleoside triphosphate hydrolase protein [Thelephora terrestris]